MPLCDGCVDLRWFSDVPRRGYGFTVTGGSSVCIGRVDAGRYC